MAVRHFKQSFLLGSTICQEPFLSCVKGALCGKEHKKT